MRRNGQVEILKNVSLFAACSDKELKQIAGICTPITVREGTILAKEGAVGREFYAIGDGKAKVTLRGKTLATLGPGDFFGEMSLLDAGPRTATVKAESEMELYVLEPREFSTLVDQHPAVAKKMLKAMAQRLREVEKAPWK
jgi:CRP/FNR family transcriptional regulator, cyclic AMP receptor protein